MVKEGDAMSNISVELDIKAPKERVYSLLADPDQMVKWLNAEDILVVKEEDTTDGPLPAVDTIDDGSPAYYLTNGSKLDLIIKESGRDTHYEGQVISCQLANHMHLTIGPDNNYLDNYYELEDSALGTHLIFTSNNVTNSLITGLMSRFSDGITKKLAHDQIDRLKKLAESYPE